MAHSLLSSLCIALLGSCFLLYTSLKNHTRTGPKVKEAIEKDYTGFAVFALLRLGFWSGVIIFVTSWLGSLIYIALGLVFHYEFSVLAIVVSGGAYTVLSTAYLFCHHLLYTPSLILVSAQIRFSRLDPLWKRLSPARLKALRVSALILVFCLLAAVNFQFGEIQHRAFIILVDGLALLFIFARLSRYRSKLSADQRAKDDSTLSSSPNIVMIGSDTLRADRLGAFGYHRDLSPKIDELVNRGFTFHNCYTPLARTAPSLASLLTGCWPHTHKIRSNFPDQADLTLPVADIAQLLAESGYNTAAIGDWAAADLGKLNFGFQHTELPEDQWNLKLLIRQGSAFIRLFLSLYSHNRFGKRFLPEIYYLAGIPLSQQTGRECRNLITQYSKQKKPFFINYFSAVTHVPFGSDYPYYQLYTDPDYQGESRFLMTSISSPEEIIEKQGMGEDAFDLTQINDLYDGCVRQFDDEVGKILDHLSASGLDKNTIVVIYSDHGADFFENGCWGQGNTLMGNDPSNRIPLIIYDPRQQGGIGFKETVRSIDIAPTLLDLANIKTPSSMEGSSLSSWLDDPNTADERYSFQETGIWLSNIPGMRADHVSYPNLLDVMDIPDKASAMLTLKQEYYAQIIRAKDRCIRDNKWKLIYFPTTNGIDYQLFDMEADPQCSENVAEHFPEIFQKYRMLLDTWIYTDPIM